MKLSDTFIPTAGAVGLLPMLIYALLLVALAALLAQAALLLGSRALVQPGGQWRQLGLGAAALVMALVYACVAYGYGSLLAELATVTDGADRQTLFREAYPALTQYRYMGWLVALPLLVPGVMGLAAPASPVPNQALRIGLIGSLLLVMAWFIGEQQLTFDQEMETTPRLLWGVAGAAGYGLLLRTLLRVRQGLTDGVAAGQAYGLAVRLVAAMGGIWLLVYAGMAFGLPAPVGLVLNTLADLTGLLGAGLLVVWHTRLPLTQSAADGL
ncbi:hypothetical protein GCM10027578_42280 [Spirosoma luteolum]